MSANIIAASSNDIQRASFMMQKTNGTINPIALGAKVAMIAELKRRFEKGEVVEFDFGKKGTNEIRHAVGCLPKNSSHIAAKIKGNGTPNKYYGNLTYWDLTRNAFRVFSYETLLKIY